MGDPPGVHGGQCGGQGDAAIHAHAQGDRKLQDMRESSSDLTKEKREILLKILHTCGKQKLGLSGRRAELPAPTKKETNEDGEVEYMEMPRFADVSGDRLDQDRQACSANKYYVSLKQGTLSLFEDHQSQEAVISYNLADCQLEVRRRQAPMRRYAAARTRTARIRSRSSRLAKI